MAYNFNDERQDLADSFELGITKGQHQYFDTHEFVEIIDYYLERNDMFKAEKAIDNALNQHPFSVEIKLRKADWLLENNMPEESLLIVEQVLEYDNYNSEANELKGDILIEQGLNRQGINYLQKALFNSEDETEILSKIGLELMQMERADLALNFFLYALDLDITDDSALYNAIYCYEILDDFDGAIAFLRKYIDQNSFSQIAWHQLGNQYSSIGEFEQAIECFDQATKIDESFLGAYFEKARCFEELGRHKEALEIYKYTQGLDDPTAFAYYRMGLIYEYLDDMDEASKSYFSAIHQDPMYAMAWYRISSIFSVLKNSEKALEYAEKAYQIEPDNAEIGLHLAELYLQEGDKLNAEDIFQNYVNALESDRRIWDLYSQILLAEDDLDSAIEILLIYNNAIDEDDDEFLILLSSLLYQVDRIDEAFDILRKLTLHSDFEKIASSVSSKYKLAKDVRGILASLVN